MRKLIHYAGCLCFLLLAPLPATCVTPEGLGGEVLVRIERSSRGDRPQRCRTILIVNKTGQWRSTTTLINRDTFAWKHLMAQLVIYHQEQPVMAFLQAGDVLPSAACTVHCEAHIEHSGTVRLPLAPLNGPVSYSCLDTESEDANRAQESAPTVVDCRTETENCEIHINPGDDLDQKPLSEKQS